MKDFLRFVFLTASVLFTLGLIWFGLQIYGQSRPPGSYQTELVQKIERQAPIQIHQAIPWQEKESATSYLSIEILFSNNEWVVRSLPKNISLAHFLEKNRDSIFFAHLRLNKTSKAAALKTLVSQNENWRRMVFVSDSDGTLKDLRELDPRWTFTTGDIFLTRFLSLSAVGLHTLLKIPGDIFLVNPAKLSHPMLEKLISEAKKQRKLVLLGPVKNKKDIPGIHGWVLVKD